VNKTEEYLDSLLNNVSPERKAEADRKKRRTSADFVKEFENDLDDTDIDDVILEFENEIGRSDGLQSTEDSFFGNLEGIVNTAKEASAVQKPKEDTYEVNTLEDDSWTESNEKNDSKEEADGRSEDEKELFDVLAQTPTMDEISNLTGAAGAIQQSDDDDEDEEEGLSRESEKKPGKKGKKDKKEKDGFFQKLSKILFGEDEDELEEEGKASEGCVVSGEASEEGMEIVRELNESEEAGKAEGKKEKGKKKKDKKEKKEKEKKPKEKKEKKPKEKKEKKPKKPKEVDLSPPLPKAPVILIFIMCFSGMLFVILTSNMIGYSADMADAKAVYNSGDYVEAYHKIAGLNAKEQDVEFGERVLVLAKVQGELKNGIGLYSSGQYVMALDSFICALGRYDANYADAKAYGVKEQYERLLEQITAQLQEKFNVSAETAREIYGLGDRTEYTRRVYVIVKEMGLTE